MSGSGLTPGVSSLLTVPSAPTLCCPLRLNLGSRRVEVPVTTGHLSSRLLRFVVVHPSLSLSFLL